MIRYTTGTGPAGQRTLERTNKTTNMVSSRGRNLRERKSYPIELSQEFARRLGLQGLHTVSTGVIRVVCRGAVGAFVASSSEKLPDERLDCGRRAGVADRGSNAREQKSSEKRKMEISKNRRIKKTGKPKPQKRL